MIWHQIVVSIWNFGGVPLVFSGEVLGIANVARPALTDVAYEPSSSELDVEQPKECHGGNQGDPFPPNPDMFNTKRNRFNTMFSVFTCLCLAELFEKAMEREDT